MSFSALLVTKIGLYHFAFFSAEDLNFLRKLRYSLNGLDRTSLEVSFSAF